MEFLRSPCHRRDIGRTITSATIHRHLNGRETPIQNIEITTFPLPTDAGVDPALRRLFDEEELTNPQFGLAWLNNLSAHALDAGDEAQILVSRRSPEDLVALPLLRKRKGITTSLSTFYTSTFVPLVRSTDPMPLFTALFRHLARKERAAQLQLMPLDSKSEYTSMLSLAQHNAGWRGVHHYFCFGNWIHDTEGESFNQYLSSRPSRLRNTIRRRSQKFVGGDEGQLSLVTDTTGLDKAIEHFNTVYHNSWKRSEPYPEFIPSLIRLAADKGWLRLGLATYKGIPVASQIWLVTNGTAYIYKLAYDDNYKSQSPGTVLTSFMFQQVMGNDAVQRIDYLSGDDVYKKDWMSVRHERVGTAAFNPGTLRGLWQLSIYTLKRLLKRKNCGFSISDAEH